MAELARLGRVSRARMTQVMDLLMLAPEIQEEVLCGSAAPTLREMTAVVRRVRWAEQRSLWHVIAVADSDPNTSLRGRICEEVRGCWREAKRSAIPRQPSCAT